MVAKAKPMKKRKSDNRLRISSFCMHTQAHKLNKKKQWDGRTLRSQNVRWEMVGVEVSILFWGHFRYAALFRFTFFIDLFLCHTAKVTYRECSFDSFTFFGLLRTGFCYILNFKLEMELLRRKMRHDLSSKRLSAKWYFCCCSSILLFLFSSLNNNLKHNFTLIYTFHLQWISWILFAVVLFFLILFWSSSNSFLISWLWTVFFIFYRTHYLFLSLCIFIFLSHSVSFNVWYFVFHFLYCDFVFLWVSFPREHHQAKFYR